VNAEGLSENRHVGADGNFSLRRVREMVIIIGG
jgi:hypothetical protein